MKNWGLVLSAMLLAALPSSSTYQLHNYSIGTGGTSGSASSTYSLNGTTGEQSTVQATGTAAAVKPGNNNIQNANVPTVTIANSSNYYNKLLVTIGTQGNPTDTLYAIAISTDAFSSTTNYIKSDNTITNTLTYPTDYRTYSSWGSGSGVLVIGLSPSTTYTVKAKAIQGKYSESPYGPTANATTSPPQLSFSLTTTTQPSPPFSIDLGLLLAGTVVTATSTVNIAITTNGDQGGQVYIYDTNSGLKSTAFPTATIASASADLAVASNGYGAQVSSVSQVTSVSPYNGSSANVGIISTSIRKILNSTGPLTAGTASITMKAKSASSDTAAPDYADIMTFLAAGSF